MHLLKNPLNRCTKLLISLACGAFDQVETLYGADGHVRQTNSGPARLSTPRAHEESGRGQPHSMTLREDSRHPKYRQVVEIT